MQSEKCGVKIYPILVLQGLTGWNLQFAAAWDGRHCLRDVDAEGVHWVLATESTAFCSLQKLTFLSERTQCIFRSVRRFAWCNFILF